MTAKEILEEMEPLSRESYNRMLVKNYGVKEPCFGVPIGDLKKFQKRIKKDYQLALDLYDAGNYGAMYLAGLIADDARMTRKDLQLPTGGSGEAPFCIASRRTDKGPLCRLPPGNQILICR